jgi:hypothetical protein
MSFAVAGITPNDAVALMAQTGYETAVSLSERSPALRRAKVWQPRPVGVFARPHAL